jgi:serine/threonine-protein kinase
MVSRAYSGKEAPSDILSALSQAWDLAARASRLEGEVASLTRKLDALERRGRALRAEIGRKVEDLAQEESRVLREAAAWGEDIERVETDASSYERQAQAARAEADAALRSGRADPAIFERAGATQAMVEAKREQADRYRSRQQTGEKAARSLRRQIEQLRGQLSRYAEALEEDLTRGRNQVAERTREGLRFEKAFNEVQSKLVRDLRDKPECRDLLPQLLEPWAPTGEPSTEEGPYSRRDSRDRVSNPGRPPE